MNNMKESINNVLVIENQGEDFPNLFKQLLSLIYTEKWDFPTSVFSMIELLCLTDEYMLHDLMPLWEYEVIKLLEPENVVRVLTDTSIFLPLSCEDKIKEAAKEVLISEFPIVLEETPNVEDEVRYKI